MRKNFIIVITAILTLFSFACADTNPAVVPNPSDNPQAELSSYDFMKNLQNAEADNSGESSSTESTVGNSENESDNPSYNIFSDEPDIENYFDYYSSDGSVFIRQDINTNKSYINDNGKWIEVDDIATGAYGPRIEKFDFDGDEDDDYLIAECEGSGSGFSVYGLVIIQNEGENVIIKKYDYSYFVSMMDESIGYNYNEKTHELQVYEILPPYFDRYEGYTITLDLDKELESIVYSDIINIYFEDGKIYMSAPIGCCYSDIPYPDYDNTIRVTAELHINDDLSVYPFWYIKPDSQN